MRRCAAALVPAALLVAAGGSVQTQDANPAAGFHHVHLNAINPAASIAWYAKTFDVTTKATVAGVDGIQSEQMYLLFDRTAAAAPVELNTAIWHFGWGSPNMEADFAKHQANGVTFATPINRLASGTMFAYMKAPDGNLVEINTGQTHAFTHVHMLSAAPLCAADWYEKVLGAKRAQGRAGAQPPADCHVPFAAPSEPLGVIRAPAATVRIDDINLILYPQQRPEPLVSTRGHVNDHIAVSYPDVAAAVARLRTMGVRVLADVHNFGNTSTKAAMIEGPDSIAIELVERSQR
jgi:catechol 2,3-dioxygenase-like lactoylglutathione lyase family enzyme